MPDQEYRGWLVSNSFLKRAFAVWGHFAVAHLIIVFSFGLVAVVAAIILGMMSAGAGLNGSINGSI